MSQNIVSKNNSYSGALGALGVFTGEPDVLTSFAGLTVSVGRTPLDAPGELRFQFSTDRVNWADIDVHIPLDGSGSIPIPLQTVSLYFRVIYTNGVTPLTELRLTTLLHRSSPPPLIRFSWQPIDLNEPVTRHQIIKSALPDGAATEATLDAAKIDLDTLVARTPAAGALTDAQLRATPVPVSGPLTDTELRASAVPVTVGSALPAGTNTIGKIDQGAGGASAWKIDGSAVTQPVSGPLTDTQLRASAVPVSNASLPLPSGAATSALQTTIDNDIKATQPRDVTDRAARLVGHVTVDNFPATQPVSAVALPLPAGASTSALQTSGNASLTSLDGHVLKADTDHVTVSASLPSGVNTIGKIDQGVGGASAWKVDGSAVTQPVSAVSLPLPTGAATSAAQTTGNTSLASIDTKLTHPLPVTLADSNNFDAFSRLRVSNPQNLFDSTFQYGTNPTQWGTIVVGGGTITHRPLLSAVELGTTSANADRIVLQTKRYMRYQPGKSQLVFLSAVAGAAKANVRRRMGYYDDNDGIFIEQNGTTDVAIVRRTFTSGSPVDNRVVQASWNIDTLDGSGPSGLTLDLSKANLLVIDLQWLSVGRVRVGFDINGDVVYFHQFLNANVLSVPWSRTANLPVRYEMTNLAGTGTANTFLAICSTVMAEGGHDALRYTRSANSGITPKTITTRSPLVIIRPALLVNSITNRGRMGPLGFSIQAANAALWELVYNPASFTGASFTGVGGNTIAEFDVAATALSGGDVVASGYTATNVTETQGAIDLEQIELSLDPAGAVADTFALVVTSLSGGVVCRGSLTWTEEY